MNLIEQIICEEIELMLEGGKNKPKKRLSQTQRRKKVKKRKAKKERKQERQREEQERQREEQERQRQEQERQRREREREQERQRQEQERQREEDEQERQREEDEQERQREEQYNNNTEQTQQPQKPTLEGGAACDTNDLVGTFINSIKKKIEDLSVGWPRSLFSMNEDDETNKNKSDVEEQIRTIAREFIEIKKKSATINNIRKMFTKLFELWTITNTDIAKDYNTKCNALKKNLKNYRNLFTTYRSQFINNFRKLDINKPQLQREYRIIEDDIAHWKNEMDGYSPKLKEILRDHIAMLEDCLQKYKSRMFWYFKAPKFMRKKSASKSKSSSDKWAKRAAAYKRFRQRGRKAIKNYFAQGPKAGSNPSSGNSK